MYRKILSILLAILVFASALSIPAFAVSGNSAGTCPYCGSPLVYHGTDLAVYESDKVLCSNRNCKYNQTSGRLLWWTWEDGTSGSGGASVPSRSNTATAPKKYYTSSGSSGGGTGSYNTVNSGNTSYYSTINTTNKTLNYTTYNQTTNNYVNQTYNYTNYTYNYDYNYYTVNVDNSTHYVIDNVNYITVIYPTGDTITNIDGSTSNEYDSVDIYYQLPSGQNSYNLTPSQVWGEYFVYNVTGCDKVLEDDGKTLGLWHLDGDFSDSSANAGEYTLTCTATTFVDTEIGDFNQAVSGTNATFAIPNFDYNSGDWTLEYRVYIASSKDIVFHQTFVRDKVTDGKVVSSAEYGKNIPSNQWNTIAHVYTGGVMYTYLNGSLVSDVTFNSNFDATTTVKYVCPDNSYGTHLEYGTRTSTLNGLVYSGYPAQTCDICKRAMTVSSVSRTYYTDHLVSGFRFGCATSGNKQTFDEIRLSRGVLYSDIYTPSLQPYDTNSVLVLPQNPAENDIAIMSNVPVTDYRIGGARPTYPETGNVYIYLEDDIVKSVQQYQGSGWVAVDAQIYSGGEWKTLKNYNLKDIKSEELETKPLPEPDDPGPDKPDPPSSGCDHEYAVTKEKAPTCTESGYKIYKCSLCGDTYTDTMKALGHDWQLVESTLSNSGSSSDASSGASSGESAGYALYRCSRCNMEYKDFNGSGPPADKEDGGFWGWLKDIAGSIFGGILDVLESIVGGSIGLLVSLIDSLFEGIVHIVDSLFAFFSKITDFGGAFKDFLAAFFSYIPEEIIVLLAFSISLSIILMVIKFFKG